MPVDVAASVVDTQNLSVTVLSNEYDAVASVQELIVEASVEQLTVEVQTCPQT